jgi:hypothetical protein
MRSCSVAPTIDDAIKCTSSEPTLAQQLSHGKDVYRQELTTLQTTQLSQQRATFDYEVAAQQSGAALAPVRGYIAQRDVISAAAPPAKPLVDALFAMPTTFSSILLAFIGGLLGSACLLLILLTFPTYLPLTFGGGNHFFLRMFTGGAVAVIVMLVLMTGTAVPGLEGVKTAIGGLDVGEPAKQGMIAIASGFLAEQIAKFAKNYSDRAFGNDSSKVPTTTTAQRPIAPPARTVPPAPVGTPAMGPGAMDEGVG